MQQQIGVWLATSPVGGAIKAASGAVLVWLLDNVASFNLPAISQVAIVAALPVLINAVNPEDPRYGSAKELTSVSE
jgi:membrane carboxypeptidase/penicillin-binding protein PbpC